MRHIIFILTMILAISTGNYSFSGDSRIKDLITIKGVRENPLFGYGLVIGLNGTGDSEGDITSTSMRRMFNRLGINPQKEFSTKNVAAVIVTAQLPPFARLGQKIDVNIASIGNASSLAGGTLLITPLKAADNEVYAVANGQVSIGGLKQGAKFATNARVAGGATIEKELEDTFELKASIRLSLNNPDFTTAYRIENTINTGLGGKFAKAKDSATIDLLAPPNYHRRLIELIALIENYRVNLDTKAKIIINERTGTIITGGDIVLKEVAISHGDLTVEIGAKGGAGKGGAGGGGGGGAAGAGGKGGTKESLYRMEEGSSLNDLVKGLNALGVTPEDLISIFQALKKNGALVGEIEFI
ncbi:MAG: flagellar basal body P-ring protein FlgI [Oligoflexia bacterium]|nr:flagellar basal body P-ring protein FlgI [Oligoflexia bacterium]